MTNLQKGCYPLIETKQRELQHTEKLRLTEFSRDKSSHSKTGSRTSSDLKMRLFFNMEPPNKSSSRALIMFLSAKRVFKSQHKVGELLITTAFEVKL